MTNCGGSCSPKPAPWNSGSSGWAPASEVVSNPRPGSAVTPLGAPSNVSSATWWPVDVDAAVAAAAADHSSASTGSGSGSNMVGTGRLGSDGSSTTGTSGVDDGIITGWKGASSADSVAA